MSGKFIKRCFFLIIFIFLCSYFIYNNGYYEYHLHNKSDLTKEQILQFERDVKDGRDIDIHSYLEDNTIDYSNQLTKTTSLVNIKLNDYLKNIISESFKIFEKLVR